MNSEEFFKRIKDYEYLDLKIYDINGGLRHVTLPASYVTPSVLADGVGFDASNFGYMHTTFSDMITVPDLSTVTEEPFADETLSVLCDVVLTDKTAFNWYPRNVLKNALKHVKELEIANKMIVGPEMEFNIFKSITHEVSERAIYVKIKSDETNWPVMNEPAISNDRGYHVLPPFDSTYDMRNEIVSILTEIGMPIKYHHHEVGISQFEIEFQLLDALEAADWIPMLKYVVRNVVDDYGYVASFLPKPLHDHAGNGMHVHQYLARGTKNVFDDPNGLYSLSKTALSYIAGLLKHAPAVMAFTNPSTNSYKRLVPGFEAPTKPSFALGNRDSAIRIPAYVNDGKVRRIEFRMPDATANPHYAMAAMLLAGIDGVKNDLDPQKAGFGPFNGEDVSNVPDLPTSLDQSLDALEKDHEFLSPAFTSDLIEAWIEKKRKEIRIVNSIPNPIEYELYFGI